MSKASTVIVGNANLVKQVVFPLEVLPAKGVIATVLTELGVPDTALRLCAHPATSSLRLSADPSVALPSGRCDDGHGYLLSARRRVLRDTKDFIQVLTVVGVS